MFQGLMGGRSAANDVISQESTSADEICENPNCDNKGKTSVRCFLCGKLKHLQCDPRTTSERVRQIKDTQESRNLIKIGYQYICNECTSCSSSLFSLLSRLGSAVDYLCSRVSEIESQVSQKNNVRSKGDWVICGCVTKWVMQSTLKRIKSLFFIICLTTRYWFNQRVIILRS